MTVVIGMMINLSPDEEKTLEKLIISELGVGIDKSKHTAVLQSEQTSQTMIAKEPLSIKVEQTVDTSMGTSGEVFPSTSAEPKDQASQNTPILVSERHYHCYNTGEISFILGEHV